MRSLLKHLLITFTHTDRERERERERETPLLLGGASLTASVERKERD